MTISDIITLPRLNTFKQKFKEWVLLQLEGKISKADTAVTGNFASFNSTGSIQDSGKTATDFATNTQGGYADSALQSVSHGTDGQFVTTTVGSKSGTNGNKSQAIGVAITTQSISSATQVTNGLATAYDVKTFINEQIASGIKYMGSVPNYSQLPLDAEPGHMYNVVNDSTVDNVFYPGDMNYIYTHPVLYTEDDPEVIGGTKQVGEVKTASHWDAQAPTINIDVATDSDIIALFNT